MIWRKASKMIGRIFKPNTLDFETAIWEIFHLIINPKKMYRSHYYYRHQNGVNGLNYTRDDPLFLILLTGFLTVSSVAWGLAYSPKVVDILKLIVYSVFVDFYLTGAVVATISWVLANKVLFRNSGSRYSVNYIDWWFCFDIHCNSFLVIWCLLYLLQFLLLPILVVKNSIFGLLLGNLLYYVAVSYYFIVTFYGFSSLPFLTAQTSNNSKPAKTLQIIILGVVLPLLTVVWLLATLFGVNIANLMVDAYFN
ncbi:uncharacterized protein KQ657_003489 [Scheffersomyces spartinae]|uniref:Uncharacterized protein n=1 Tax=Scheffersomyces spartinae TaxID=45513 RepID=A0A9P7V550_9ASCO|nr:uncharacterized protein KQ657_003489 [Scheffersomyces spartinae]KAG7191368.1 hypothetical protein KQ657_003489 [Scheffersomyces spartinae]